MERMKVEGEKQDGKLSRRVVHLIKDRFNPSEVYKLITSNEASYTHNNQERLACRDRAFMSTCFCDGGRVTEIIGGPAFSWNRKTKKAHKVNRRHRGLEISHLEVNSERILIRNAPVVKRSQKIIDKYGITSTIRDDFVIPLKIGSYDNPFWDQLVPFGWLLKEYLDRFAPKTGKLFCIEDTRGWQIIKEVTGNYPNWFRSQAENFYGHYLLTDSVKLAKFVKVQDPMSVKHYIGYDWTEQLKNKNLSMDFEWIEPAIEKIKERLQLGI